MRDGDATSELISPAGMSDVQAGLNALAEREVLLFPSSDFELDRVVHFVPEL